MLHLTHMETIGVRELQQKASAVLRRIQRGEVLGVTERGRLIAILGPPSSATGTGALLASGRVRAAKRPPSALPVAVPARRPTADVLNDLRADG